MSAYATLTFEIKEQVAIITFNRPNANGIDIPFAREFLEVAIACEFNPDVRAVLITGNGKMFSGGGDLKAFSAYGERIGEKLTELTCSLDMAITRFCRMDKPVITAVNGTAAGAGVSVAIMADYVLASDKAKFTMAYAGVGLSPDVSVSFFLPRLIGHRRAQDMMITNRVITAETAEQWGMINQVVAADELQTEAFALARKLAQGPTRTYGKIKKLLQMTWSNTLESQMDFEAQYISELSVGADAQEGIAAFLEGRPAQFKGQ